MNELRVTNSRIGDEPVSIFRMREIVVDEISSCVHNEDLYPRLTVNLMFSYKTDIPQSEELTEDEYLDDTLKDVHWGAVYQTYSYAFGDIDEEIWLKVGRIVGLKDPDVEYYRENLYS